MRDFVPSDHAFFVTVAGSHAHGTATPESDVDVRGVLGSTPERGSERAAALSVELGTPITPRAAASSVAVRSASFVPWACTAFWRAFGCSSQAAAAIITLSGSVRSRPPANACRNAASEKATTRPACFA